MAMPRKASRPGPRTGLPRPVLIARPPGWMEEAACDGMSGRGFDPWHPEPADEALHYALARLVCAGCPVRMDCLRLGLKQLERGEVRGMYAGLTPPELRALAREHGYPTRKVAQHGTRARYVTGCRCGSCRRANAQDEHGRRVALSWHEPVSQVS